MKKRSSKIVFFGSGPVAARSLAALADDFDIEAAITKPSTKSMISEALGKASSKIYTVSNKAELDELITRQNLVSRAGVIVDFGIIVSRQVIDSFPLGIVNSHFSLLPQWRGADPISSAILSGQPETGVSLMLIDEKLDEGPLLAQKRLTIQSKVTTPELTDHLIELSNQMLAEYLPNYLAASVKPLPQDMSTPVSYSRKLTKEDGEIDWQKPADQIEREVRAYIDWPKSYTTLSGIELIILEAEVSNESGEPGKYRLTKSDLVVFCGRDALRLRRIQPAGKKEMPIQSFLAGYKDRLKA